MPCLTSIYFSQAALKIIAAGFTFNGKSSYMRSGWNVLDLFIVVVSALVLILEPLVVNSQSLIWLRALKSLRVLRIIRIAMQIEGVQVVIKSMGGTVPWILRVLLVSSPFYLIFAIIGVNLLMGKMFACTTRSSYGVVDQGLWSTGVLDPYYLLSSGNINKSWCLGDGSSTRVITTDYYHSSINVTVPPWPVDVTWGANGVYARFDNLVMSLVTLFQVTVLCNWGYIMGQAMQATGVDSQPLVGANDSIGIFFVVFIFVCCFWILNLIIGIAIRRFKKQKERTGQSAFLTKEQQEWLNLQRLAAATMPRRRYPKPSNPVGRFFHKAVLNDTFDKYMIVVIILDTITMFLPHQGMSQSWNNALFACNATVTAIYALEAFAKMMAAGIRGYFTTPWFRFEFFVLILCGFSLLLTYSSFVHFKPTFLPLARLLRVMTLLKILPLVRGLYMMMVTLVWSLPAVMNVYSVVLVFMFIYAIIGMNIFGYVKFQSELGYNANFVTFPIAMLVMFRISTNDNWNYLMQDSMILEDCILVTQDVTVSVFNGTAFINTTIAPGTYLDSVDNSTVLHAIPLSSKQDQCSPSPTLTVLFYLSFVLIVAFLMVQLFISIVIECIEIIISREKDMLNQHHLSEFMSAWEALDPESSGFIPASDVAQLLLGFGPPLGSKNVPHPNLKAQEIIFNTDIPLRSRGSEVVVHYVEVLHAVLGRVAGTDLPTDLYEIMIQRLPPDPEFISMVSSCDDKSRLNH
jgi:hypothetical protein